MEITRHSTLMQTRTFLTYLPIRQDSVENRDKVYWVGSAVNSPR